jgi:hypothetical protein
MSQAPNTELPANLMFRLRALLGVNARADILAYLLTHADGHPPDMARQTGYFPRTVQMTLAEMAYSGKIYAARKGREKHYRVDGAEWALLRAQADPGTAWPRWVGWPQWFAAMTAVWRLAQDRELAEASASLQAAEWQKLMGQIQPWLAQSDPGAVVKDLKRLTGAAGLQAAQAELTTFLTSEAPLRDFSH